MSHRTVVRLAGVVSAFVIAPVLAVLVAGCGGGDGSGGGNVAPVADAGPNQTADVGRRVTFDGSASADPDGSITRYRWDFGDGATATGATVKHAYTAAGTYTVKLTVTDNRGKTNTDTMRVTVTEGPPAFPAGDGWRGAKIFDDYRFYNTASGTGGLDGSLRCRECHGWQGEVAVGTAGANIAPLHGMGSLAERIAAMTEAEVALEIWNGRPAEGMPAFSGVFQASFDPEQQTADLANFLKAMLPDYDVNAGDATAGATAYNARGCGFCHGADGRQIDFHKPEGPPPEYLGEAQSEPEEFAHRIQFGHPRPDDQQTDIWALVMPAWGRTSDITTGEIADVIAHLKTLPDT